MNYRKSVQAIVWSCALVIMVTGAFAADLTGKVLDDPVTFSGVSETSMTVSFVGRGDTSKPDLMAGAVVADPGQYDANYLAAGIQAIRFKVASDGLVPQSIKVFILGTEENGGRVWNNANVDVVAGGEAVNTIGLGAADGWTWGGSFDQAAFNEDLQNVELIGIKIYKYLLPAQSYTISDFVLLDGAGDAVVAPMSLSIVEKDLFDRFGRTKDFTTAQQAQDSDNDGLSDLKEIVAGTDADSGDSIFAFQTVATEDGGIRIAWEGGMGRSYTVKRAAGVLDAFGALGTVVADESNTKDVGGKTLVTYDDPGAASLDSAVYKVVVE